MAILMRLLVAVVGLVGGSLLLTHSYQLTHLFGYNSLAERYLGNGGTYSMWKLIGVLSILGSLWYAFH